MDALTDAARRGISTQEATLYTTTFPCHNCARHAVAAGIARVVYVEPYPKSRAVELHQDAIVLEPTSSDGRVRFEPFVGVGARLYQPLFRMMPRKDGGGRAVTWRAAAAVPRLGMATPQYVNDEELTMFKLLERLEQLGILSP